MDSFPMRARCKNCNHDLGRVETRNGQDCVFCLKCGRHQYNAPKTETGRAPRTVGSVHEAVRPKDRVRILLRANGRCELCGKRPDGKEQCLHVGHLISVSRGLEMGMTEVQLNSDENLVAMCDECNLGLGDEIVPLRLAVAIVLGRLKRGNGNGAEGNPL